MDKAKSQALRFLAAKPRTRKELETKLVEDKGYDIEDANEALNEIERLGLHSDKLYSEQWARMKWRQSRWNKWKVASELKKRGVNENDVEDGLWKVYADWERSLREALLNVCRDYEDACAGNTGNDSSSNNALRFTHESDVDVSGAEGEDEKCGGWETRERTLRLCSKAVGFGSVHAIFKGRFARQKLDDSSRGCNAEGLTTTSPESSRRRSKRKTKENDGEEKKKKKKKKKEKEGRRKKKKKRRTRRRNRSASENNSRKKVAVKHRQQ